MSPAVTCARHRSRASIALPTPELGLTISGAMQPCGHLNSVVFLEVLKEPVMALSCLAL
jgi:hypothetical protein